ncbi:hydrogenase nickel incorporation protein HypB [Nocardioides panacis]|uniref:Hydrogenase nickel incorporation protein HypB n=1 Tax=Nocardioides panacis TaxID=2849501 RepID=A0A975Y0U1_9ACTN|nr:hydrogenase nickel incorporation protein HypB [Nocardioides panacis]QWZ08826.1 hydrogenase nickel incorporation protein HypB [Nocardioides panacis]
MCATCGCGEDEARVTLVDGADPPEHEHPHGHEHPHPHPGAVLDARTHTLELEVAVLARNDETAGRNRAWLTGRGITAVNLMSSPGAGKTTLLERTIRDLGRPVSVIEGDQETVFDAARIRAAGARAVQVNTGAGCHLDASMVERALAALRPEPGSLLVVENVGNLVCPALFDLGEARKVVVISVTEGDDKPLKYPHMFAAADLVVLNKTDLLPYVEFDPERLVRDARQVNPDVQVLPVSARTGANVQDWYDWLG